MKRLLKLISMIAVCALFTACGNKQEQVDPPFFKVENESTGATVYMLGSMHAGLKGTVYPDEILSAYEESPSVACELDLISFTENEEQLILALSEMLCPDGTTAKDYFGDSYDRIKAFYRSKGIYSPVYDRYIPAFWSSLLSNKLADDCDLISDYGTENIFLEMAHRDEKKIIELESGLEQYRTSADAPMSVQVYSVEYSVDTDYEQQIEEMNELYRAWSTSDEAALEALADTSDIPEELTEDYAVYYEQMYTSRHENMTEQICDMLENGEDVFLFVGALHFYAEPDILTLLENNGYTAVQLN